MSLVRFDAVEKSFGRKRVLKGMSLEVNEGDILGLIGENGSGKTTTVNILMGFEHPSAGTAEMFGKSCGKDIPERRRDIGFVSETVFTPSYFTVDRAIRFHKKFYPDWDDKYGDDLVRRFSLDRDDRLASMSRGQLARLDLVLALAHRPKLLILDEITAGLDALVRHELIEHLREIIAQGQSSILFATNMLHDLEKLATRIAFLTDGKIAIDSTVDDMIAGFSRITFRSVDVLSLIPEESVADREFDADGAHLIVSSDQVERILSDTRLSEFNPTVSRLDLESTFIHLARDFKQEE